jgi:hypothetical protein
MGWSRYRSAVVGRSLSLALALAVGGTLAIGAEKGGEKGLATPNQDYLDEIAALNQMVSSRDLDLYEVSFEPVAMDRIVIKDRLDSEQVFNYLVFRIRNKISDVTVDQVAHAKRYNEILKTIAEQYESAKVENNVTLKVDGEEVLDRKDLRSRDRVLNITAVAYDENGSRIRLIDDPVGSGVQETYNFPDLGELTRGMAAQKVREKIEEKLSRRLLTIDEIRKLPLPPYDAKKVGPEGTAAGEIFGVMIFNRLSIYGDRFTIEMRGLNNKFRIKKPEVKKVELDKFLDAHYFRRVYTLHYSRIGDEFYEDQNRFILEKQGWEWKDTFQRIDQRSNIAYSSYFVDNIADDKGERNTQIEKEFWPYYSKVRETRPDLSTTKLKDIEAELKDR